MRIRRLEEIEKTKVTMEEARGAWKQVPISKADGSPSFSFRVFTLEPGGHTPYHTHPFEHLNYIIEGEGILVDEKGVEHAVAQGEFVLVLPGEKHQYRNNSGGTFAFVCAVPKEYE